MIDPRRFWRGTRESIRAHERLLRPDGRMHASEPKCAHRRLQVLDGTQLTVACAVCGHVWWTERRSWWRRAWRWVRRVI